MNSVPNQKVIRIQKTKGSNEILYTPIVVEAFDIALSTLSPAEYKVWSYLIKNKDGYILAFSSTDCASTCKLSKSTCKNAINRLIQLGYLTIEREDANVWQFHDIPLNPADEEETLMNIKFEF